MHEQPSSALSLLQPQMFLTVNPITGSKARITNHRRLKKSKFFGASELQQLPSTFPCQCPVLVSGREPAHTYKEQRLQSPAAAAPKKAAEHPLCSLGVLENSFPLNAPANIPMCTQLSALKPRAWSCISSSAPTLRAQSICKGWICCCSED